MKRFYALIIILVLTAVAFAFEFFAEGKPHETHQQINPRTIQVDTVTDIEDSADDAEEPDEEDEDVIKQSVTITVERPESEKSDS